MEESARLRRAELGPLPLFCPKAVGYEVGKPAAGELLGPGCGHPHLTAIGGGDELFALNGPPGRGGIAAQPLEVGVMIPLVQRQLPGGLCQLPALAAHRGAGQLEEGRRAARRQLSSGTSIAKPGNRFCSRRSK